MSNACDRTTLHLLELLFSANGPIPLVNLAIKFSTNRSVDDEMRQVIGGPNQVESLRRFLLRYPALFRVDGDVVVPVLGTSLGTSHRTTPPSSNNSNAEPFRQTPPRNGSPNTNSNSFSCSSGTGASIGVASSHSAPVDLSMEAEAVRYFQVHLMKREERWNPIKSLAGHLSQASSRVRAAVGPQGDFLAFLMRHSLVFEVQGELVGLRDTFSTTCLQGGIQSSINNQNGGSTGSGMVRRRHSNIIGPNQMATRPRSMIVGSRRADGLLGYDRSYSGHPSGATTVTNGWGNRPNHRNAASVGTPPSTGSGTSNHVTSIGSSLQPDQFNRSRRRSPISMTANEYKAVIFLKACIEESKDISTVPSNERESNDTEKADDVATSPGNSRTSPQPSSNGMSLTDLLSRVAQSRESIRNTIGWTAVELEEFLHQHPLFFTIQSTRQMSSADRGNSSSPLIFTTDSRRLNILITGSRPHDAGIVGENHTLTNRSGRVYHVAKLWGIIDLGQHEHVFFDKSILRHVSDLQKHFRPDECVYFNAILAPKNSRAKWRATQVWKETDRELVEQLSGGAMTNHGTNGIASARRWSCEETGDGLVGEDGLEDLAEDIRFLEEDDLDEEMKMVRLDAQADKDGETLLLLNHNKVFNSVRIAVNGNGFPHDGHSTKDILLDLDADDFKDLDDLDFEDEDEDREEEKECSYSSPLFSTHSEPSTMRSIPSITGDDLQSPSSQHALSHGSGKLSTTVNNNGRNHSHNMISMDTDIDEELGPDASLSSEDGVARSPKHSTNERISLSKKKKSPRQPFVGPTKNGINSCTVATQTVSTGEIMATQFYQESS